MIVSRDCTIDVAGGGAMPAYLSRPAGEGRVPAVIVLEGVYGFDDELRRITDLLAGAGFAALAINYFHRTHPDLSEPFSDEGRARGEAAAASVTKAGARSDVAAARDWLDDQPFVERGHIGTLGFGFGGTIAFVTATLPGILGAVAFYGQSIARPLPNGDSAPLEDAREIRAPLLLTFGGADALISEHEIGEITATLQANGKPVQVQIYPNVGHSFFRATYASQAMREAADAWDLTLAFFRRHLR